MHDRYAEQFLRPTDKVTHLHVGILLIAPRGGGYCGEYHHEIRKEPCALVAIRQPTIARDLLPSHGRVQFRDGTSHWVPMSTLYG